MILHQKTVSEILSGTTQKYAKFATHTEEWEARNKTRMDALHEALAEKDKRRKGGPKK